MRVGIVMSRNKKLKYAYDTYIYIKIREAFVFIFFIFKLPLRYTLKHFNLQSPLLLGALVSFPDHALFVVMF